MTYTLLLTTLIAIEIGGLGGLWAVSVKTSDGVQHRLAAINSHVSQGLLDDEPFLIRYITRELQTRDESEITKLDPSVLKSLHFDYVTALICLEKCSPQSELIKEVRHRIQVLAQCIKQAESKDSVEQ